MVVLQHLGGVSAMGVYAVFGFYTLSGYLMTLILHSGYDYSRSGIRRYALNRFLRIYPIYWVACAVSIALIVWLGNQFTTDLNQNLFLPDSISSFFQNFLILFGRYSTPRLLSPTWALSVELLFYVLIGLGVSRSKTVTCCWFGISVVYAVAVNLLPMGFMDRYNLMYAFFPAASLPFSTGAMIYYFREGIVKRLAFLRNAYMPAILFMLVILNYMACRKLDVLLSAGFYLNFGLNALLLVSLIDRKELPLVSRKLDKKCGDFSYPIYLIHFQAALFIMGISPAFRKESLSLVAASLPVILVLAWLLTVIVERPIEKIRQKVKGDQPAELIVRNPAPSLNQQEVS